MRVATTALYEKEYVHKPTHRSTGGLRLRAVGSSFTSESVRAIWSLVRAGEPISSLDRSSAGIELVVLPGAYGLAKNGSAKLQ